MAKIIDTDIPESFHRLKRTVVLLCAALVVWSLSTHAATGVVTLPWIEGSLPASIVPWLLWLSAAYYLIGFLLEVGVAVRLNSRTANLAGDRRSFDEAMEEHATRVGGYVDNVRSRLTDLGNGLEVGPDRMRAIIASGEASEHFPGALLQASHTAVAKADVLIAELGEFTDQLAGTRAAMTKLDRDITGQRRLSFWAWEVGGAVAAFAVASAIGFCGPQLRVWLSGVPAS